MPPATLPPATLHFLGTADSKGVPRFWCSCPVCQDARGGGVNRRTRSAALLRAPGPDGQLQTLLLDCGPDLHGQLARLQLDDVPGPLVPDAVLVSHAHNDHLLGLGDLLDYHAYAQNDLPVHGGLDAPASLRPLSVYAPAEVLPQIENRFQYAFRGPPPVLPVPEGGLNICGFTVRPFRVPHGANGFSYAFRFDRPIDHTAGGPPCRWVYMTDAIGVPIETAERWLTNLDLLVLGSSFADESGVQLRTGRSVYDVREALALPWAQAAGRVLLTHLSHGVDARFALPDPRYHYAVDGLTLTL